jgi:hypothetical protein
MKSIPLLRRLILRPIPVFLFAAVLPAFSPSRAEAGDMAISAQDRDVSAHVDSASGAYRIAAEHPAWTFGGSLDVPLQHAVNSKGRDELGEYRQIAFEWDSGAAPMSGWIRIYDGKALALFSQTCGSASKMPPAAFPSFTSIPGALHVFSYEQNTFSPPSFSASRASTPWLLFDDEANACIISPATHFMVASMLGDGRKEVASGFNPALRNLPAGFTQQTLVAFGRGINRTWEAWGAALLGLQHAKRPANDADDVLKYLGYWTDKLIACT